MLAGWLILTSLCCLLLDENKEYFSAFFFCIFISLLNAMSWFWSLRPHMCQISTTQWLFWKLHFWDDLVHRGLNVVSLSHSHGTSLMGRSVTKWQSVCSPFTKANMTACFHTFLNSENNQAKGHFPNIFWTFTILFISRGDLSFIESTPRHSKCNVVLPECIAWLAAWTTHWCTMRQSLPQLTCSPVTEGRVNVQFYRECSSCSAEVFSGCTKAVLTLVTTVSVGKKYLFLKSCHSERKWDINSVVVFHKFIFKCIFIPSFDF